MSFDKNLRKSTPIGLVLKGYPRLSETFISQEILELQRAGYDLHIISLRHPTDKAIHPINREITAPVTYLPEYVHWEPLRVLKAWWNVRKRPGYARAWRAFIKDLKGDFCRNRFRRFAQALVIAHEFGPSSSQCKACLYAHFLHTPTSATRYAAKIMQVPFAISAHAKDIWTSPSWEIKDKLEDCRWLATCTLGAKNHLETLSSRQNIVNLVYHGLDLQRFPAVERREQTRDGTNPHDPVRIVTVGRAVPKKGIDLLIDALSRLPSTLHWHWTHIGGGPLKSAFEDQVQALNIAQHCTFKGAQAQSDVLECYRQSDLFVLPCRIDSSGDRDGLPNVIVEAQSQGLAVVSTPISGIPELIEHKRNGLLVPVDDADALKHALVELIRDPTLRSSLGDAGQAIVHERFNHKTAILGLFDLMDQLLEVARENQTP